MSNDSWIIENVDFQLGYWISDFENIGID